MRACEDEGEGSGPGEDLGRVGFDFAGEGGRGRDLDGDFVAGLEVQAWLGARHALEELRVARQRGEIEELLTLDGVALEGDWVCTFARTASGGALISVVTLRTLDILVEVMIFETNKIKK